MRKSLRYSLVCKHLFTLKDLTSETDLDFNNCLLIYDTFSWIAIVNKKLFVANHQSLTFLNIAG